VALDVLNVIELRGEGVIDIDDNDLPVGLAFVEEGHHAENLDLLDLTRFGDELADFANVEGVVVTLGLGLGVGCVGVFPCLEKKCVSWIVLKHGI
jgi:hypothetical protein